MAKRATGKSSKGNDNQTTHINILEFLSKNKKQKLLGSIYKKYFTDWPNALE